MNTAAAGPDFVTRCQQLMAHAWMVRTFIKHCEEADDFPDLSRIVRAVFDISRALDTRVADPDGYVKMLRKKLPRFRAAVEQFARDAPVASTHTNFQQAVLSIEAVAEELTRLLATLSPPSPEDARSGTLSPDGPQQEA